MTEARPWVLGLAASHNGAACLMRGDEVVVAVQEERLTRVKRARLAPAAPFLALDYVLDAAGIDVGAIDLVVVAPLRSRDEAGVDVRQHPTLGSRPALFVSHHAAHAASAWATSGFEDAAILIADGMGSAVEDLDDAELSTVIGPRRGRETISIYDADIHGLRAVEKQVAAPEPPVMVAGDLRPRMMPFSSLGVMYQAVAQQIFGGWFDAGKVMGLAPYGARRYLSAAFFRFDGPHLRFADAVAEDFRHRERWPAHEVAYADLAHSTQAALEDAMLALAERARTLTGRRRLCLGGGVAMNSVANERIIRSGLFDEVHIVPAAEDCGTAWGAAWLGVTSLIGPRRGRRLGADAAGRSYDPAVIDAALRPLRADPGLVVTRPTRIAEAAAARLAAGDVLGWFQGRSELGARALGQRSILLDPRRADGKAILNERVKGREAFRPFAPAILLPHAHVWLEVDEADAASPFMMRVIPVRPERRAEIPAVTHVDGSARAQTVSPDNGLFYEVITAFYGISGVPIVLNTSFNVAGEPIVESPADAIRCFLGTGIDALAIGPWLVQKV